MRTVRFALLLCEELTPEMVDKFGSYTKVYHQFLSSSLAPIVPGSAEITFTLEAFDVVSALAYPPGDVDYDGLLISGSRASAYEDVDWINKLVVYVKHIISSKPSTKVFGFCFGHQIIARALGFGVRKGNWEVSMTRIQLTPVGKAIFRSNELNLQLIHQDEVSTSLPGAHLLGSTVSSPNQGFVVFQRGKAPLRGDQHFPLTSIHVLTLQAHPEFTEPIVRTVIDMFGKDLHWNQDFVEEAVERAGRPTDAIDKAGRVVWGMLGVASEESWRDNGTLDGRRRGRAVEARL